MDCLQIKEISKNDLKGLPSPKEWVDLFCVLLAVMLKRLLMRGILLFKFIIRRKLWQSIMEEQGKRVLISGCSHKGILNIVEWFKPDVLVGGFHFSKLPLDETLEGYAKLLDEFHTTYYTCHCTGETQYQFMKNWMRRLSYVSAGDIVTIT